MSTSERSQAYGRVVRTLREAGSAQLLPAEQDLIREAADALLFSGDPAVDESAGDAVAAIEAVAAHLVESDRWTPERASELIDDVLACGHLEVARADAA
jgi:hypothetical protein